MEIILPQAPILTPIAKKIIIRFPAKYPAGTNGEDRMVITCVPMTLKFYGLTSHATVPEKGVDAIGNAICHIGNIHKYARKEDRPEKTLFIITTDGMENASRRYTFDKVKQMVERQKEKYGWEFLFLGANMDAIAEAGRFGIDADRSVSYISDHIGTRKNYAAISRAVSRMRACSAPVGAEWKDEIEADYKARKGK